MPIHRLNERPTRHAVLGDITCDSDGKIDQFIDRRDVKRTLPLHAFNGEPYYLGVFLVGAYQEILGDLHNLFGDTHAVHVSLDADNTVVLEAVIKGDTVREVLDYVEFDADMLVQKLRIDVEAAVRDGRLDYEESGRLLRFYEDGLHGYTYLEERQKASRRKPDSGHPLSARAFSRGSCTSLAVALQPTDVDLADPIEHLQGQIQLPKSLEEEGTDARPEGAGWPDRPSAWSSVRGCLSGGVSQNRAQARAETRAPSR